MPRQAFLRLRYAVTFKSEGQRTVWNARVAEEVRLPTWSFEVRERGAVVFVRAEEETPEGPAVARLFLHDASDEGPPRAEIEVALRGRWDETAEARPPLAVADPLVAEAEALLVLLGCRLPKARFEEALRTRK